MAGRGLREVVAALAAGAVLGAMAYSVGPASQPAHHSTDTFNVAAVSLDLPAVRERLTRAVVRADVEACGLVRQGTVTMIATETGPTGLTNAHVVRGAERVQLSGAGLGVSDGSVQEYLDGRDAATVDLEQLNPAHQSPLQPGPSPQVGDEVVVAGFPDGSWAVSAGSVHSIEQRGDSGESTEVLLIDVPVSPGISGGVVADSQGRAVGLVVARDPQTGWAVAYPLQEIIARPAGRRAAC